MEAHVILSAAAALLAAAAVVGAFFDRAQGYAVYGLQLTAFLLAGASSWLTGAHTAALCLAVCAAALLLRACRLPSGRYTVILMIIVSAGGLIVNNRGWAGVLCVIAAVNTVFFTGWRTVVLIWSERRPPTLREFRRHSSPIVNAVHARYTTAHGMDLLLENILGVALWGAYAALAGDAPLALLCRIQLAVNAVNLLYRMRRILHDTLYDLIPVRRYQRRKRRPDRSAHNWMI